MTNEQYFIGQILNDPDLVFKTTVKDNEILSQKNRIIFITIKSMLQRGVVPDLPTIHADDPSISVSFLADLTTEVFTSANWKLYEKTIKEDYRKTQIRTICGEVLESKSSSQEMITELMKAVDGYIDADDYGIVKHTDSLNKTVDEIESAYLGNRDVAGIKSGISGLDRKMNGFQKRKLYIIGGRPSQGKTALIMNFVLHAQECVGIMSAESGMIELDKRLISLRTKINGESLGRGDLKTTDFEKIIEACGYLTEKTKYFYYDKPNMTIEELLLKAREMKQRFDIKALYVDYLQQIKSNGSDKRHEQVADVSIKLKALARNLNIPVICAAQLKRGDEKSIPQLSDLGNSGQIERDADCVMMIHHGKIDVLEEGKKIEREGSFLVIKKNRDGATGIVEVMFKREHYGFYGVEFGETEQVDNILF